LQRPNIQEIKTRIRISLVILKNAIPVPLIIASLLIFWWYFVQDLSMEYALKDQSNYIASGFIRTLSHIDPRHLLGNVLSIVLVGVIIGCLRSNTRILVEFTLLTLVSSVVIGFQYSNGVGYSFVVRGIISLCIVSIVRSALIVLLEDGINKENIIFIVLTFLAIITFLPRIIFDLLVVLNLIHPQDLNLLSLVIGNLPSYYTKTTSVVHTIGFLIGLVLTLVLDIFWSKIGVDSYLIKDY
jgi:hypothetical protein